MNSINETTDAIWSAIQRVSPAVSREEIASILRVAMDAPTADEDVHPLYKVAWSPPIGIDRPSKLRGD